MSESVEPFYVKGTRILTPDDYDRFVGGIHKHRLRTIFEVLFYTGMRYVELQRLYEHPGWVMSGRNVIHLPEESMKKTRRKQLARYIPIAPQIKGVLPYFFENPSPSSGIAWTENLKRWAWQTGFKSDKGFSGKMTRKTIESWMLAAGIPLFDVCLRQGHDSLTALRHYIGTVFTESEKNEIKKRLSGW